MTVAFILSLSSPVTLAIISFLLIETYAITISQNMISIPIKIPVPFSMYRMVFFKALFVGESAIVYGLGIKENTVLFI
jgi:hypothetical protein